MQIFNIHCAIL